MDDSRRLGKVPGAGVREALVEGLADDLARVSDHFNVVRHHADRALQRPERDRSSEKAVKSPVKSTKFGQFSRRTWALYDPVQVG
jgi:hypothetical protein